MDWRHDGVDEGGGSTAFHFAHFGHAQEAGWRSLGERRRDLGRNKRCLFEVLVIEVGMGD